MRKLVLVLMIIGGLNWGLIGFFKYNLVDSIFGPDLFIISRIIYALVGLGRDLGNFISFQKQHERGIDFPLS